MWALADTAASENGGQRRVRGGPLPIRRRLAALSAALLLVICGLLASEQYWLLRRELLRGVDARLLVAAHLARQVVGPGYFDRLVDVKSVTSADYDQIVARNNELCRTLGLQYLWSCMVVGQDIRFTTSTSPGHEVTKGDHAKFFEVHRDPHAFDTVFRTMRPDYSSFRNEWGWGRMVLVPATDRHGRRYCFGASVSTEDVYALLAERLRRSLWAGLLVVAAGVVLSLWLARSLASPLERLTALAERVASGDLTPRPEDAVRGSAEVVSLAASLATMRESISATIGDLRAEVVERQRAQEALASAMARHQAVLDGASQGIVLLDADSLEVRYANPALRALLGYGPDEPVTTGLAEVASVVHTTDAPLRAKGGHLVRVDTSLSRLEVEGRPALAVFITDVSERSRLEAETARLEDQMRQTQKMEAIGRLAGGVAHDFNNLLTAICGYCELALDRLAPTDPVVADLREVRSAGERARELTQQLLAFGRRQVLAPTVLDLGAVVRDTERMLHRVIGEDIDLRTILAGELGCVMADAGQMQQVLLNLAINARDAMPAGGTLTIETTDVVLDEIYAQLHPGVRPGPHVMLAVCDTGVGMDAATQAHAFEPFFTTKPVGQGTGLGLASVYGIVKQSGGDIRVHSEPGLGTTFRIYLPRVDAAAAALPLPAPAPAPTGGETILVVEDEQRVRQYAQRVLEAAGYRVLMADGGVQALALAAAPAQVLDLLLTDVVMPGMNGREVAEALLARRPDLRVLFMSGYADNAVVERGLVDVGVALLAKPFSGSELLRRVRDVLDASSARPTTPAEPPAP